MKKVKSLRVKHHTMKQRFPPRSPDPLESTEEVLGVRGLLPTFEKVPTEIVPLVLLYNMTFIP